MDEFDAHRTRVADRQAAYEKTTQEKAILIRDTEAKNIKAGKKKQRGSQFALRRPKLSDFILPDLASFRKALVELQNHVNVSLVERANFTISADPGLQDLDHLKAEHYMDTYESEQEVW